MVLLLLGKLAGVRMPVWKKDSLTAVASPLKWGRVMEVGGMGPGMQCGAKADAAHCVFRSSGPPWCAVGHIRPKFRVLMDENCGFFCKFAV